MSVLVKIKTYLGRYPWIVSCYRLFFPVQSKYPYARIPVDPRGELSPEMAEKRLLNALNYTKTSGSDYSALQFPAGYHEIELGGRVIAGQRKPKDRIAVLPIDFAGKRVLDIGCNQGGMLFSVADQIAWGVGVDYDYRMINAANLIARTRGASQLGFYVFDIDRDPHGNLQDFLPDGEVDVVFLLSVCMWVQQWRELIRYCQSIARVMVFESNGSDEQQREQIDFLRQTFAHVEEVAAESTDDPMQKRRKLFVAQ